MRKGSMPFNYEEQVSWDRPEQVRDSGGKLWIECRGNLLSASCRFTLHWHTGGAAKGVLNERTSDKAIVLRGQKQED